MGKSPRRYFSPNFSTSVSPYFSLHMSSTVSGSLSGLNTSKLEKMSVSGSHSLMFSTNAFRNASECGQKIFWLPRESEVFGMELMLMLDQNLFD